MTRDHPIRAARAAIRSGRWKRVICFFVPHDWWLIETIRHGSQPSKYHWECSRCDRTQTRLN